MNSKKVKRTGSSINTETHKWCPKCETLKPRDAKHFYRNRCTPDGLSNPCKVCSLQKKKEKLSNPAEKKKIYERNKLWRQNNPEKSKASLDKSREKWRKNNPDAYRETQRQQRIKRRKDPVFRLRENASRAINFVLKRERSSKKGQSYLDHLPYTPQQLKEHLESQFEDWMTWENYGNKPGCWSIDHIIPQSKLPYDSLEHPNFVKCWSLENLRPMDHIANVKKSNRTD
jgi:hypothetical protein